MAKAVRRIVTGHHADGRSKVLVEEAAPNVKQRQAGNASTLLWVTDGAPANATEDDSGPPRIRAPPPPRPPRLRPPPIPPGSGAPHPRLPPIPPPAPAPELAPGPPPRRP